MKTPLPCLALLVLLAPAVVSAESPGRIDKMRAFLTRQATKNVTDADTADRLKSRIAHMSPAELEGAWKQFGERDNRRAETIEKRYRRAEDPAYRASAVNNYQQRLQAARGNAGFQPVIAWLPEGASLGVGAVVSPDRRYVRITAAPFFSSVGPVRTFNFGQPNFGGPAFSPFGHRHGVGAVVSPVHRHVRIPARRTFSTMPAVQQYRFGR
jgi:hypothetical protein